MTQRSDAKQAYDAWLATLQPKQRALVQGIMAIVMVMLDDRYNNLAADVARIDRRQITNSERIADLQLRLDHYESQQWSAAKEAIEQFAQQQLPVEERDRLIEVLYTVVTKVEALEQRALGGAQPGGQEGGDRGDAV